MNQRVNAYLRLMRFDRPIGILLLLWPTAWALWIAGDGSPRLRNVVIFGLGVVLMRAAGCVMNDIADRHYDPHVERTRSRPLAAGEIGLRGAIACFIVLMTAAFGLVLLTNPLTVRLAFVGAALAATYPFFKRWTHLPQVVLGIAFGWSTVMAFAAETGSVPPVAWALLAITTVWSVIYDTLYAMVDIEDDRKIGVKSTAILFGAYDLVIIRGLELLMVAGLAALGWKMGFSWPWFVGVAVAAALMIRQQSWIRERNPMECFRAFLNHNWVGMAIFAGLLGHYCFEGRLGLS